jgi:uncharacterized protein (DUF697 family)
VTRAAAMSKRAAEIPAAPDAIERTAQRCRRMVNKRALLAAGVAMVPLPGVDWITDIGVLIQLLPQINAAFGLTPQQVERLSPERKLVVYKVTTAAGGLLLGRLVTKEVVIQTLKAVGVRLSTQQAAKYVPIAGQALSAALTFSALKYVCEQHIRQCMEVSRLLALPAPVESA